MALKRCTSTEHLWNRKLASLASPVLSEIFLPKSDRSWQADVLKSQQRSAQRCNGLQDPRTSLPCGKRQALPPHLTLGRLHWCIIIKNVHYYSITVVKMLQGHCTNYRLCNHIFVPPWSMRKYLQKVRGWVLVKNQWQSIVDWKVTTGLG